MTTRNVYVEIVDDGEIIRQESLQFNPRDNRALDLIARSLRSIIGADNKESQ